MCRQRQRVRHQAIRCWNGIGMGIRRYGGDGGGGGYANSNMYAHIIRRYYLHELFNFEILNLVLFVCLCAL